MISENICILLIALILPYHGHAFVIVSPTGNTTWVIGQVAQVRWVGGPTPRFAPPRFLSVDLLAVPSVGNVSKVARICDHLDVSARDCAWTVPEWMPTFKYSLRINYNVENDYDGDNADYGEKFTILGQFTANDAQLPREPAPASCLGPGCQDAQPPSNFDPQTLLAGDAPIASGAWHVAYSILIAIVAF